MKISPITAGGPGHENSFLSSRRATTLLAAALALGCGSAGSPSSAMAASAGTPNAYTAAYEGACPGAKAHIFAAL